MITINLLPQEMRRKESTPLPRRLSIFGGTGFCAALLAFWVMLHFRVLPGVKEDLERQEAELAQLERRVRDEYDRMVAMLQRVESKRKEVKNLLSQRIHWAPRLDALWTAFVEADGTWLIGFELKTEVIQAGGGGRRGGPPALVMEVVQFQLSCAGRDFGNAPRGGRGGSDPLFAQKLLDLDKARIADVVRRLSEGFNGVAGDGGDFMVSVEPIGWATEEGGRATLLFGVTAQGNRVLHWEE
jgi:hypothetical protein